MNKINLPRDFLYEFQLDPNLTKDYLEQCIKANINFYNTTGQPHTAEYGYPIVKNDELLNQINKCLKEVCEEYFNLPNTALLKVNDIWITRTNFMSNAKKHYHSLSIFSGLLYLNDSDITTVFTVEDEFMARYEKLYSGITKPVTGNIIRVKPSVGKLIIWPSYVSHQISSNTSKSTRYTLAFNSFFDGILCEKPTLKLSLSTDGPDFI